MNTSQFKIWQCSFAGNISGRELLYKNGRFLIKKVFRLFLSFNLNVVNGLFILDGSNVKDVGNNN